MQGFGQVEQITRTNFIIGAITDGGERKYEFTAQEFHVAQTVYMSLVMDDDVKDCWVDVLNGNSTETYRMSTKEKAKKAMTGGRIF